MPQIDTIGTYVGEILDSGINTTKNGFPQWVARLKAVKKYVDDAEGMKHFGLNAAGYVDWSEFNETTNAYLVLFKSSTELSKDTALFHYEDLQKAVGWNGQDFESLDSAVGKLILFRVGENTYEGKTTLQVQSVDSVDADPVRGLKTLDQTSVTALSKLLRAGVGAKAPVAAKAAAAAAKPATTKPGKSSAPSSPPSPAAPATSAAVPPTTPTTAPKSPSKAPPSTAAAAEEPTGLPGETTQLDAWNYVEANKAGNKIADVEEAWLSAVKETLDATSKKKEEDLGPADWAKVRDLVIKDLAL